MLKLAAEIGVSEDVFWDILPREFDNRLIAFSKRVEAEQEAAWNRAILVANELRGLQRMQCHKRSDAMKIKDITLDQLKKNSKNAAMQDKTPEEMREEFEALCAHIDRVRATGVRRVLSVQKVGRKR